jgi:hypothetical protein
MGYSTGDMIERITLKIAAEHVPDLWQRATRLLLVETAYQYREAHARLAFSP